MPSPNNLAKIGNQRDAWVPNHLLTNPSDLANFAKLGLFLTVVFLAECKTTIVLPEIILEYFETSKIRSDGHDSYRAGLSHAEKVRYELEEF